MKKLLLIWLFALLTSICAYAQKSFDMRYNEAVEYYTQKQFDKSIKVLEAAKKSPGVTKEQISKAVRLIKQCQASKQKMSDLNLSKESVFLSGAGQKDSVYVTAGKAWEVTSSPDWCKVWKDVDIIYLQAKPNELKESRQGVVEVTMGKERTAYVLVTQEKRQNINCPVRIHTVPGRAIVYVDSNPGMLTEDFILSEGSHRVVVEKSGYLRKDTTLVVNAANASGMTCLLKLIPTFATISVDVKPAAGYDFDTPAVLDISGNEVNLHPSIIKSFNVDQELSYYSLYEDNRIPLHPGQYIVKAIAEGFKPQSQTVALDRGVNTMVNFCLEPICGTLSVNDEENALGALVFVDGKEAGTVPISNMKLKEGPHSVRVEKSGLRPELERYDVVIKEDDETVVKVSMQPYSEYSIVSDPPYCKVYLDGELKGNAPMNLVLLEGEHELRFEKNGYFPQTKSLRTDLSSLSHDLSVKLEQAYPVLITSDRDSLWIKITQEHGNKVLVPYGSVKTPAEVSLPLSKKPYRIELSQANRKKAFRGNFFLNNPDSDHKRFLSWSDGPAILSGQWYISRPSSFLGSSDLNKSFQRVAEANLLKFKIIPGLSTSLAKASLFLGDESSIVYPANDKGRFGLAPGDEGYKDVQFLPALTVIFLNEEFRMGGALFQYCDIDMLATYAWYPDISKLLTFSHMSGHDIFLGLELGSRIPVFNVSVRAGVQAFYGQANIARPNAVNGGEIDERYVQRECVLPVQRLQFVAGVCFTLGGKDSKGQNILRIF